MTVKHGFPHSIEWGGCSLQVILWSVMIAGGLSVYNTMMYCTLLFSPQTGGSPTPHGTAPPSPLANFWSSAASIINSYVFQHSCRRVAFNPLISPLGHTPCPSPPSPHAGCGALLHCAQQASRRYSANRETKEQKDVKGESRSMGNYGLMVLDACTLSKSCLENWCK